MLGFQIKPVGDVATLHLRASAARHYLCHSCPHQVSFQCKHAAIAQLGERQTEDLKVPGSIPGLGRLHFARARKVRMRPT
jgi:hypothetical protein